MYLKSYLFLLSFVILLGLASCKKDEEKPQPQETTLEVKPLLETGAQIITQTYSQLHFRAELLESAVDELKEHPTEANLELARTAWRNARIEWEQSEGFLFGPVDSKGIDPGIDSWPLNKQDLDAVLNSNAILNKTYIDGLEGTQKGFHTIEYLLFGENADKKVTEFTPRQFDYLTAVTESFEASVDLLYDTWSPEKENFAANLIHAGTTQSIYPSQKSALQDLVNGIINITDEVGNGKIQDPLAQKDVNLEESQFSDNSKADFQDNIRSVQNIYIGTYKDISSKGLSVFVAYYQPETDVKVKKQIQEAIDAIGAIPGTFTNAIFTHRAEVEYAQNKVRTLQQTLESEVLPLLDRIK